jgi:RluA family pseudouridine synthase
MDPGVAAALVAGGSVYIDGRRVRDAARPLAAAQTVTVHEPIGPAGAGAGEAAAPAIVIVHQDADVVIVDKPAGLPTMAARDSAHALDSLVAARVPGAIPLHRLDRDASGLVLFARNDRARASIQQAFDRGDVAREYLAISDGQPREDRFTIDREIGPDPCDRRKQAVAPGARAITHVTVVARGLDASRAPVCELSIRLETGRTHQIRVHLASIGHPILGDRLYAPPPVAARAPRLLLHAIRLRWPGGQAASPRPPDFTIARA